MLLVLSNDSRKHPRSKGKHMSKTLSSNLNKQNKSAGISRASGFLLRFIFAAGCTSRGAEWESWTMWLSSALLLLSFPGMFTEGLGAWDSRCRAAGRGLCPGFKESYHLQGNVGWLCGFIQQKDPRFYTVLGMDQDLGT